MMPTWVQVEPFLKHRIEMLSRQLEGQGMPVTETEFKRGQLAALREVLALPNRTESVLHSADRLFAAGTDR